MPETSGTSRLPVGLHRRGDAILVEWLLRDGMSYTEPFFSDTIIRLRNHNRNNARVFEPLKSLMEPYEISTISPTTFIFHISRCGSTLFTQLLAEDERNIVLSEVPILDQILSEKSLGADEKARVFQHVTQLYCRPITGTEQHAFIKLDAWHIYYAAVIRRMFPQTPFIFLYRDPAQVIASHRRMRGGHLVPGIIEHPAKDGIAFTPDLDDYAAYILRLYFETAQRLHEDDGKFFLLNYNEGIPTGLNRILKSLDIQLTEEIREKMERRAQSHSKYAELKFVPETQVQLKDSPALQGACRAYADLDAKNPMNAEVLMQF